MTDFAKLRQESDGHGETNDCGVIAVAIVCETTYATAHRALEKLGRRPRGRTKVGNTEKGARELGKKTVVRFGWDHAGETLVHRACPPRSPLIKAKTMISAEKVLQTHYRGRKFLLFCRGHVAAFDGEALQDWTKGRRHRVVKITEVI